MALSGTVSFNMNAKKVIERSFSLIGVKAQEQPLQAAELQDGIDTLNLLLKSWQAQGLHLWKTEEAVLFLNVGQQSYSIGSNGDKCCDFDDFIGTKLSADADGSATFTVEDTLGMVAGDYFGVVTNENIIFWTTIFSVDNSTTITTNDVLGAYEASSGNPVYTFTSLLNRPLRILSYRRKTFNQDNEIPVESWSRQSYFDQVNKASQGTVVNAYYSPQLTDGRLYVWQTASSADQLLRFTYEDPIEDIDVSTNDIDIPVEWLETVIYNLGDRLCDIYYVTPETQQRVSSKAALFLANLLGFDQEMESINVQPYAKNRN